MRTLLASLTLIITTTLAAAPSPLADLSARHAQQLKALRAQHENESLRLIEQQVEQLEKLARTANAHLAQLVRAEIDRLLKSTDAGRRVSAKLFVDTIDPKNPGAISALTSTPEKLAITKKDASGRWARVPEILLGASIYSGDWKRSNGVADFEVTRAGRVFLALNYDYQGNGSGGWTGERLLAGQFMARGWARVKDAELLGWNNRTYPLFTKVCVKGEKFRLRCNKYEPPFVVVLDEGQAAKAHDPPAGKN